MIFFIVFSIDHFEYLSSFLFTYMTNFIIFIFLVFCSLFIFFILLQLLSQFFMFFNFLSLYFLRLYIFNLFSECLITFQWLIDILLSYFLVLLKFVRSDIGILTEVQSKVWHTDLHGGKVKISANSIWKFFALFFVFIQYGKLNSLQTLMRPFPEWNVRGALNLSLYLPSAPSSAVDNQKHHFFLGTVDTKSMPLLSGSPTRSTRQASSYHSFL